MTCPFCGSATVSIIRAMVTPMHFSCFRCKREFSEDGRELSQAEDLPPLPPFLSEHDRRKHAKQFWRELGDAIRAIEPSAETIELMERHKQAVRAERYRWLATLFAEIKRVIRREGRGESRLQLTGVPATTWWNLSLRDSVRDN